MIIVEATLDAVDEIEKRFPPKEKWLPGLSNAKYRRLNGLAHIYTELTGLYDYHTPIQKIIHMAIEFSGYMNIFNFDYDAPYDDIKKLCDTMRALIKLSAFQ